MPQTGATRYQKFLKSEKAKTKLKGKKELPKGTNVTKTNFKVKKIVLKEQLKKHGETEALSTRKLNINELLSRLNHFNTNSRTDALEGLRELVTLHPEVLERNLGQLILGVTPLVLNIEKVVRRDSLKVLLLMLKNVSIDKIDPFYDVMSTYLRSAMTHIDNRIQEDSLQFLDILLLTTPSKIAEDFHRIVPNFLDMISKLRVDSKPGRTLTVNLGSQITSVKWRVKVLHRLQDYLRKFVLYKLQSSDVILADTTKFIDKTKLNRFPLFNPNYISVCHLSCFSSKKSQETLPINEVDKFLDYIDTLMPLLFETWLEACPNASSEKNIETIVSEDAALLLKHSLEVISLLWSLVENLQLKNPSSNIKNVFSQKYHQAYTQHFVKMFPFVTNARIKQNALLSEDVITDPKLTAENFEICHLFIMLNPNINVKNHNQDIMSILNYIEKSFNHNSQDFVNDVVVKLLETIFSKELNSWTKTTTIMDSMFQKIIWVYFNQSSSNTFKQKIFSLLCKIALNDNLKHFHQSDGFITWLKNLPDILLEDTVNEETIHILHKFAVQDNKTFNAVLRPKLTEIVKNLPNLKIIDAVNNTTSYYKMFALLYWIEKWDEEPLNILEQQLMDGEYENDYVKFICDALKLRHEKNSKNEKIL